MRNRFQQGGKSPSEKPQLGKGVVMVVVRLSSWTSEGVGVGKQGLYVIDDCPLICAASSSRNRCRRMDSKTRKCRIDFFVIGARLRHDSGLDVQWRG